MNTKIRTFVCLLFFIPSLTCLSQTNQYIQATINKKSVELNYLGTQGDLLNNTPHKGGYYAVWTKNQNKQPTQIIIDSKKQISYLRTTIKGRTYELTYTKKGKDGYGRYYAIWSPILGKSPFIYNAVQNGNGLFSLLTVIDNKIFELNWGTKLGNGSTDNKYQRKAAVWNPKRGRHSAALIEISNAASPITTSTPKPTSGEIIFYNDKNNNAAIEIYRENGTMNPDFISRLQVGDRKNISCKLNETYSFKVINGSSFKVLDFKVKRFNHTHTLISGQLFADAKSSDLRIPNADASRHSFDLLTIDPIYIDYKKDNKIPKAKGAKKDYYGGMRKKIFKSLKNNDLDWTTHDGNIALKNQFGIQVFSELQTNTETKMFYSAKSFEKSFSANIGASTPKGGGSASFKHTSSESNSEKRIYTYSRSTAKVYDIILNDDDVQLTEDFKSAIIALPKPTTIPSSLAAAKKQSGFNAYKKFINEWGSHYPTRTGYGGVKVAVYSFTEDQFKKSKGWDIGVKAEVKMVSAGGGTSQNKSFEKMTSNAKKITFAKGGSGFGDSWQVPMDESQAIDIDLKRLNVLLTQRYFRHEATSGDLKGRQKMLQFAITDYIGGATDNGKSLKPRFFKISKMRWEMINEEDGTTTPNIYGKVFFKVIDKTTGKKLKSIYPFNRSSRGGSRVVAEEGYIEKNNKVEIIFSVPVTNGKIDISRYDFQLGARLLDYDKSSNHDLIGDKTTNINFSEVITSPKTITLKLRSDDGDIDVTATVEEIQLGFDDE